MDEEPMIERAETRQQQEEEERAQRLEDFDTISKQMQKEQLQIYNFDKSMLPTVKLPPIPIRMKASKDQVSARVIMETRVVQNLIQSYFDLVKKNIADLVPKTIMAFLVHESKKIAQSELVESIYKQGNLDQLVVEDPMVAAQRENCKKAIQALKTAQNLLGEVTQYKC